MITQTININDGDIPISQLIEEIELGSEIILSKGGTPIARLSKIDNVKAKIKFGVLKGKAKIADDFNESLPDEILSDFEGCI